LLVIFIHQQWSEKVYKGTFKDSEMQSFQTNRMLQLETKPKIQEIQFSLMKMKESLPKLYPQPGLLLQPTES